MSATGEKIPVRQQAKQTIILKNDVIVLEYRESVLYRSAKGVIMLIRPEKKRTDQWLDARCCNDP